MLFLSVNIIHWFNPLVWLLRKFAEQDIEIACDEEVIMNTSMENRREYSVVLILLFGNIINIKCGEKTYAVKKVPVDYGVEVKTDVNGDGKADRVRVTDTVRGDYAFTQVRTVLNDGSDFFIDYPDSWASSYLVTGDLSGNGRADVVVIRYYTGSTYGGCAVSVLHMGKNDLRENDFEEYPSVFIQNPEFGAGQGQPVGFGEQDGFSCIGASIIEKNGKTMLRLIACVDPLNDTVQCVDCSYQADGWYIEDIQNISGYWENDRASELLGDSY